jgi:molybdate transport system substrate-binding protein
MMRPIAIVVVLSGVCAAVATLKPPLTVAGASDLAVAFKQVGEAFEKQTGQKVVFSFGSSGLLAKQIEQGGPFDVFAAANVGFADDVIQNGDCAANSKALYARGRIAIWTPKTTPAPKSIGELKDPRWKRIAIANPGHAPYGKAALEALTSAGIADAVRARLVYGENVRQTLQFAQSGNAEVAIVAESLARDTDGQWTVVDDSLHKPLDQAIVVCGKSPARVEVARAFEAFVLSPAGRAILEKNGLRPSPRK